jgi:tetratricopeptide (TPR) repeat protein
MRARWLLTPCLLLALTPTATAQQWFLVQTLHLSSYSDGNDRGAREAALRGEQLINVFAEIFHRKDITFAAPLRLLSTHSADWPVLVRTPEANYVTVDPVTLERAPQDRDSHDPVTQDPAPTDSWTRAAKSIAALTLEDNYPRAQPWFDSGIASYLAAIRFKGDQLELDRPPQGIILPQAGEWIPMGTLLAMSEPALPATQHAAFEAESWALVRWLIDGHRLAQAGEYLNAVQWRGAKPEQALAAAFSMSAADLDLAVHESSRNQTTKTMPVAHVEKEMTVSRKVSAEDMHVLKASLTLFDSSASNSSAPNSLTETRAVPDSTLHGLVEFMRQNQENAAVHRSLAWAFLLRGDLENAVEHIRRALTLDDSDPSMHYLYARWVNQGEENSIRVMSAESRMAVELRAAVQRDPNYSAALELLGLAELSGDDLKAAVRDLARASALRPRSDRYYLNLARAYQADGNLNAARNLMAYVRGGSDSSVAAEAAELLSKASREIKRREDWQAMGVQPVAEAKHSKYDNLDEAIAEDEKAEAMSKNSKVFQDKRPVEYLKGRIVSVECESAPEAILTVDAGGHAWRMHVADRNAAVLIGVQRFDCEWSGETVTINYKRNAALDGEMVSLEID